MRICEILAQNDCHASYGSFDGHADGNKGKCRGPSGEDASQYALSGCPPSDQGAQQANLEIAAKKVAVYRQKVAQILERWMPHGRDAQHNLHIKIIPDNSTVTVQDTDV